MDSPRRGDHPWRGRAFELLRRLGARAREVAADPQQRQDLLQQVKQRLERLSKDPAFGEIAEQAKASVRLVREASRGTYKLRSQESLWLVIAGLLYLVLPFDAIPDMIPGGFLDDAAVLAFVFSRAARELERFREWERWRDEFRQEFGDGDSPR